MSMRPRRQKSTRPRARATRPRVNTSTDEATGSSPADEFGRSAAAAREALIAELQRTVDSVSTAVDDATARTFHEAQEEARRQAEAASARVDALEREGLAKLRRSRTNSSSAPRGCRTSSRNSPIRLRQPQPRSVQRTARQSWLRMSRPRDPFEEIGATSRARGARDRARRRSPAGSASFAVVRARTFPRAFG